PDVRRIDRHPRPYPEMSAEPPRRHPHPELRAPRPVRPSSRMSARGERCRLGWGWGRGDVGARAKKTPEGLLGSRGSKRTSTRGRERLNWLRQRPTLPHGLPCSTIGDEGLNFRVRDGNGWIPFSIATGKRVHTKGCPLGL